MVLVVLQRWELPEMERHLDAIEVRGGVFLMSDAPSGEVSPPPL